MVSVKKTRPLDLVLPGLLALLLPLDVVVGLVKGVFPTQATLLSVVSLLIGVMLANNLRRLPNQPDPERRRAAWEENFEELQNVAANAQLNRALGAGLVFFGAALNLFWIVSILAARNLYSPETVRTDIGRLVEAGIIVLFTLMMAAVEFAGAKIYQLGRKKQL
jgi:hypothetical protein